METSKNNNIDNILKAGMRSFPVRPKPFTPSILGMANSHGVKLSVNMTSEDKKELMSKLEEWRKARKDKLAARILTKQKQNEKTKLPVPVLPSKSRSSAVQPDRASDRQSVFERLYNNNNRKTKKPDESGILNKPSLVPKPNFRKPSLTPLGKPNKQIQVPNNGEDGTTLLQTSPESTTLIDGKQRQVFANEQMNGSSAVEPVAEKPGKNGDAVLVHESRGTEAITNSKESFSISRGNSVCTEEVPLVRQTKALETNSQKSDSAEKVAVLENVHARPSMLSVEARKQKNPLRRSISMMFRQKCRNEFAIRRSFSAKNLKEFNLCQQKLNRASVQIVPEIASKNLREGKSEMAGAKSVSFVTPKHNKSLGSSHLRTKLEDWLKKNGHPLEGYRHLRCFGIANGEKSLPWAAPLPEDHSLENSYYATAPNTPVSDSDKENVAPSTVIQQVDMTVAENWLKELHRLIVELKYPRERCEEWLTAIRRKCSGCTQLPIYWECLAALHELKGDLKSAIEDYERAIIKGGEVDVVGESLAQLFEKMVIEQNQRPKAKLEKGLDPKNIFKSTIIKFALQQKALKKFSSGIDPAVRQQLYVATPVRRSTRIQTPYKSTGEVASLQTLTPELRKNVIFKPNESLISGD